jgi:hypothetical protein
VRGAASGVQTAAPGLAPAAGRSSAPTGRGPVDGAFALTADALHPLLTRAGFPRP